MMGCRGPRDRTRTGADQRARAGTQASRPTNDRAATGTDGAARKGPASRRIATPGQRRERRRQHYPKAKPT